VLNDSPNVAWTEFKTEGRSSLHEDIACQIKFYHTHASMLMNRTLEAMEMLPDDVSDVFEFKKKDD
jgi:hypothetical protein